MADLVKENNSQAREEDRLPTYHESIPGTGAVIITQPTFIGEVGRQGSTTSPLAIVGNSAPDGYILPFHRVGIDVLRITDQLLIQQTVELLDLIAAVESENRYVIKVPRGDTIFEVAERSSGWQRAFLGSARSFYLNVFDRSRREVLLIRRRQAACSCCLCYCCCALAQQVEVFIPPYTLLGCITQECSLFVPTFYARNATNEIIYKIEGPRSCIGMSMESTFKILTYDGTREVGSIMNQWNDLHLQHNLRLIFPFEENSDMRAVLLGAAFLLQYMFFESSKKASRIRFNNT